MIQKKRNGRRKFDNLGKIKNYKREKLIDLKKTDKEKKLGEIQTWTKESNGSKLTLMEARRKVGNEPKKKQEKKPEGEKYGRKLVNIRKKARN